MFNKDNVMCSDLNAIHIHVVFYKEILIFGKHLKTFKNHSYKVYDN